MISKEKKERIITEYLTTAISFRSLGKKYDIDFRMIHAWVQRYKGKMKNKVNKPKKVSISSDSDELPTDIKQLHRQRKALT